MSKYDKKYNRNKYNPRSYEKTDSGSENGQNNSDDRKLYSEKRPEYVSDRNTGHNSDSKTACHSDHKNRSKTDQADVSGNSFSSNIKKEAEFHFKSVIQVENESGPSGKIRSIPSGRPLLSNSDSRLVSNERPPKKPSENSTRDNTFKQDRPFGRKDRSTRSNSSEPNRSFCPNDSSQTDHPNFAQNNSKAIQSPQEPVTVCQNEISRPHLTDDKRISLLKKTIRDFIKIQLPTPNISTGSEINTQFIGRISVSETPLILYYKRGLTKRAKYLLITDRQILYYNDQGEVRHYLWPDIHRLNIRMTHKSWQNHNDSRESNICQGLCLIINGQEVCFLKMCSMNGTIEPEVIWFNTLFNYWSKQGILDDGPPNDIYGRRLNTVYTRSVTDYSWVPTELETKNLLPPPPRSLTGLQRFLWLIGGHSCYALIGVSFLFLLLMLLLIAAFFYRGHWGDSVGLIIILILALIADGAAVLFFWINALIRFSRLSLLTNGITAKAFLVWSEDVSNENSAKPVYLNTWKFQTQNGLIVSVNSKTSGKFDPETDLKEKILIYSPNDPKGSYYFLDDLNKILFYSKDRGFHF